MKAQFGRGQTSSLINRRFTHNFASVGHFQNFKLPGVVSGNVRTVTNHRYEGQP